MWYMPLEGQLASDKLTGWTCCEQGTQGMQAGAGRGSMAVRRDPALMDQITGRNLTGSQQRMVDNVKVLGLEAQ